MGVVINDAELLELQTAYPLLDIKGGFTRQEEQFILYHLKGLDAKAAATAAGYAVASMGSRLLSNPRIQAALTFLRDRHFQEVRITRDKLNSMLLDAHSHATNTIEEVAAIKELGKMNDLYADAKHRASPSVQVNIGSQVKNVKQIEKMDESQLIELAGEDIVLDPEDYQRVEDASVERPEEG